MSNPAANGQTLTTLYAEHVQRLQESYERALDATGFDAAVIHSGGLSLRSDFDDQYWPLRPVPHFAHWVPLPWADCALVIRAGDRPKLFVFRDPSFWERPAEPDWDSFRGPFDLVEHGSPEAITAAIRAEVARGSGSALIAENGARAGEWGFDPAAVNPQDLVRRLDAGRVLKTAYEVECLAEANRRGARGHRLVEELFSAGETAELELHLRYLAETEQDDADTPYKNIFAVGRNAATLHHISYQRATADAPSLLVDAGVGFRGYGSDITRTYARAVDSGEATAAFAALVSGVDRLQQELCALVAVGKPYESLHDEAHNKIAALLKEIGIARLGEEALVHSGVTRKFFPHGLGHSLGVQVHDVGCRERSPRPDNPFLRNTTTIERGQVFTIEPGVYFIGPLLDELAASPESGGIDWELVDALRPFGGVRIEDNVAVVETDGSPIRNLTREAFAALA